MYKIVGGIKMNSKEIIKEKLKELKELTKCPYCSIKLIKSSSGHSQLMCKNKDCKEYKGTYSYPIDSISECKSFLSGMKIALEEELGFLEDFSDKAVLDMEAQAKMKYTFLLRDEINEVKNALNLLEEAGI